MADYTPDWAKDEQTPASAPAGGGSAVPSWAPKPGIVQRVADAAGAGFMSANLEGFGGLVARKGFEVSGYGIDKLKEAYPGKDEAWYKSKQKAIINQTMLDARKAESNKVAESDLNIPGTKINPIAFAAGVAGGADPTYLVGGGIAKNIVGQGAKKVAARVAVNAGEQAVLGAATDAAYQGADMLDGLQNKFNVERSLLNAGFGAAFGGAIGAAHEVSPFVKGLFETRKSDTTPGADPRPKADATTPITGMEPQQSFKDRAAETLKTGSEQDIHDLFKGTNIPGPWRSDVAHFVAKRDADRAGGLEPVSHDIGVVEPDPVSRSTAWDKTGQEAEAIRAQGLNEPDARLEQSVAPPEAPKVPSEASQMAQDGVQPIPEAVAPEVTEAPSRPFNLETATAHVQELTKGWKNAPKFEIVGSPEHIADPEVRDYVAKNDADGRALGLFGKDGKVRIFADRIETPDELSSIVYHEALGHHGLAEKFGDRLDKDLGTLLDRNVGQFGKKVDEWQKANPGEYGGDRLRAAEEVLAEMSEKGQIPQTVSDALAASVRDFGRKAGLKLSYSDGEIRTILAMAHAAVVDGKGRNVGLNGFRVQPAGDFTGEGRMRKDSPDFMKRQNTPKDIAEEAYEHLSLGYKPTKTRTWDEAQKAAYQAGMTPEDIRGIRGAGNLDIQVYKYDRAAQVANDRLMALAVKANSPEGLSNQDMLDLVQTTANFDYVLGRIKNHAEQVGRALNAMKAVEFSPNNLAKLQKELFDANSNAAALLDPEIAAKFLKQYANMAANGNPAGARSMLKGVNSPYWWQYILSYRQNMMLSGLSTHLKATIDMTNSIGRELIENTLALPAGAVRAGLHAMGVPFKAEHATNPGLKAGQHPAEYGMRLWGLVRAVTDAQTYKATKDTLVHGGTSRYGMAQDARIPVVSKVSDALAAQDTFFRSVFVNQNLYALGARQALDELKQGGKKYSWDDVMTLGSSYAQQPTTKMHKEAMDLAETTMLVNKSKLNSVIDQAKLIRPGMNGVEQAGKFVLNLITPFIRTSSNGFANQIVRRSPLAILDLHTWGELKAGGARADLALARVMFGTAVLGSYWVAAGDKDKYKGDGTMLSPAKLAELKASGMSPSSIKEDGEFHRTSNLNLSMNPFAKDNATFLAVQQLREAYEKGSSETDVMRGLKLAMQSIMKTGAEQTFVNSLVEPMGGFAERGPRSETKIDATGVDMARSFLPNVGIQAANIMDPNTHNLKGEGLGAVMADNIPGASGGLAVKHNVYGQPMKTGTSVTGVPTWVSKGNRTKETTDPAELELSRLAERTPAAVVTAPAQSIKVGDDKVKLNAHQFEDYQEMSGKAIVEGVRDLMDSGEWDGMDDKERIKATKKIAKDVREEARATLFPEDDASWMDSKQRKGLSNDDDD